MIQFLRKTTQNTPKLRRIMSIVYGIFIEPFASGWFSYMFRYTLFVRRTEINALKALDFYNIHCYLTKAWRRGTELDHAHRRYYKAKYHDKEVFIKVAVNDATIENEIIIAEYLSSLSFSFVIPTVLASRHFNGEMNLLAIEYVSGIHPFVIPKDIKRFEIYCCEYLKILQVFEKNGIVHADIHPNNLVFDKDNKLIVIDFGISRILGQKNTVDYVARPGTYYRNLGNTRVYDDAYSFVKMIEKMDTSNELLTNTIFKKIVGRIDKNTLVVDIGR